MGEPPLPGIIFVSRATSLSLSLSLSLTLLRVLPVPNAEDVQVPRKLPSIHDTNG